MIWIVSKALVTSEDELNNRHRFVKDITQSEVSPWSLHCCQSNRWLQKSIEYFQCTSHKGEYGVVITGHMNIEVQPILQHVLTNKKALVVINSCEIKKSAKEECFRIVTEKNKHSEMFFSRQELSESGYKINYIESAGTFGFRSTISERELFQQRKLGLVKAIRMVYDKVVFE